MLVQTLYMIDICSPQILTLTEGWVGDDAWVEFSGSSGHKVASYQVKSLLSE